MKQIWIGALAVSALTACSGDGTNPFTNPTGVTTPNPTTTVPTEVQNNLGSFTYDQVAQTLTVTGVSLDAEPIAGSYTRNAALDRGGYEAYTAQESPLDRHSTAFVREIDGTRAVLVVTGGQFGSFFGGATYNRDGAYDPPTSGPTTGLASYAGNYVGLTNLQGPGGDLLPPAPGTPPGLLPGQATSVSGTILLNADFGDNAINGGITNRVINETGTVIEDIQLAPTAIAADGTFSGNVEQNLQTRGNYGGIFGGTDARVVSGGLVASDHMSTFSDEREYGIFVLVQCGTAGADPLCD